MKSYCTALDFNKSRLKKLQKDRERRRDWARHICSTSGEDSLDHWTPSRTHTARRGGSSASLVWSQAIWVVIRL
jgi:hypothetical protein